MGVIPPRKVTIAGREIEVKFSLGTMRALRREFGIAKFDPPAILEAVNAEPDVAVSVIVAHALGCTVAAAADMLTPDDLASVLAVFDESVSDGAPKAGEGAASDAGPQTAPTSTT